jgi:hypothetical protein
MSNEELIDELNKYFKEQKRNMIMVSIGTFMIGFSLASLIFRG